MAWYDITIKVNGEWLIEIRTISDIISLFIVYILFIIIISIHIYISSTVHIDIYSIQYIIICAHGQCVADVHLCCDIDQWYVYHTSFIIISILLFFLQLIIMIYTTYWHWYNAHKMFTILIWYIIISTNMNQHSLICLSPSFPF